MNRLTSLLGAAVASLALFAGAASAQQITGAGATFPAPVYTKWGEAVKAATGIQLNYQAIGSGGGINQITNRTVDFGATDAPMPNDRIASGNIVQVPTVIGGVVPIVNIPGVADDALKLTGELLADIYLGKITKWNDPKIVELNRGVALPNLAIAPAYRADGSGTTFVFTSYLSAVSPEWKEKVGAATSVKWVVGNGARGNDGVAATVRQVRGGIGYVESAFATQNKLSATQLRNRAGQFVAASLESFSAAAENGDWSANPNFAVNLIDTQGATSWPIVSATFILLPKDAKDESRTTNVLKFFDWAYTNGDKIARDLEYVPLPQKVKDAARAIWRAQLKY